MKRRTINEEALHVSLYCLLAVTALLLLIVGWLWIVPHLLTSPGHLIAAVPTTALALVSSAAAVLLLALSLAASFATAHRSRRIRKRLVAWYLLLALGLLSLWVPRSIGSGLLPLMCLALAVLVPVWWIIQASQDA